MPAKQVTYVSLILVGRLKSCIIAFGQLNAINFLSIMYVLFFFVLTFLFLFYCDYLWLVITLIIRALECMPCASSSMTICSFQMQEQMISNLEEQNRTMLQQVNTLLEQNRELLMKTLSNQDKYQEDERAFK